MGIQKPRRSKRPKWVKRSKPKRSKPKWVKRSKSKHSKSKHSKRSHMKKGSMGKNIIISFDKQVKLGIVFGSEWPNVKTVNESSEGYKNGVRVGWTLLKIKGEPIPATFNEAKAKLTFPLTLEFKKPPLPIEQSFDDFFDPVKKWLSKSGYVSLLRENPAKVDVINQVFSVTASKYSDNLPVFYGAKWFYHLLFSYLQDKKTFGSPYKLPKRYPANAILTADDFHDYNKYRTSISFSLRQTSFGESAVGVYLNQTPTLSGTGREKAWITDNQKENYTLLLDILNEHYKDIMNSRVMLIYSPVASSNFLDEPHKYIRLVHQYGNEYKLPKDTSILDKLLELNSEQKLTTDDIQGRLLLDESVLEIVPVLTPTQQALFDKLPDIVNQYEELFNKKDELVKDIITKELLRL